jgi:hypothetical protein
MCGCRVVYAPNVMCRPASGAARVTGTAAAFHRARSATNPSSGGAARVTGTAIASTRLGSSNADSLLVQGGAHVTAITTVDKKIC